ncbi:zinc finger-like domain-containing protein [Wenjunlia tyrosinilytica]|uniref:Replication initiation protein n=1 Tax=Wenjunlia tyrosinilytica TaxID=1544741 RepID=A0A917ZMU3_9ACTN|nr:zinc finger-like domain-containing protein [Wenjunlia tyrosinilytica]GGO86490.1 replication initiation protein [Wenjunlia tyrosinilytica]
MTAPLDLRQVVSPYLRDLIELANLDRFDRVREQVERVGGCTRPIQLVGSTVTLDAATRDVLHAYSTADEPTGRLLVACGNRRATRCPACSRLYAADTYQLIKAGLTGGKAVPETVRAHPRVFATLTAPSFGRVHNRPTTATGKLLPCRCGESHTADDSTLGTPVDPQTYDYCGAVLFNAHAGALWARFTTFLRREIAARAGLAQKELANVLRLSFAKVAEYQKRGLVHFHAVVRLDGPQGSTAPPPAWATAELLTDAIESAAARVVLTVESDTVGVRELRWGRQIDVREIAGATADSDLTDRAVAAYVAKYATKGAEGSGTVDRSLYCHLCNGRGMTTPVFDGDPIECRSCGGTGMAESLACLAVERHVRQMIRTCWDLGRLPEFADLKLWKWAHMLGFRGHFSTKSRRYSTTLGALREIRRAWRTEQTRKRLELPEPSDATTLVHSDWRYLASGYSPGEELLAETVRRESAMALQLKHEGEEWR